MERNGAVFLKSSR